MIICLCLVICTLLITIYRFHHQLYQERIRSQIVKAKYYEALERYDELIQLLSRSKRGAIAYCIACGELETLLKQLAKPSAWAARMQIVEMQRWLKKIIHRTVEWYSGEERLVLQNLQR